MGYKRLSQKKGWWSSYWALLSPVWYLGAILTLDLALILPTLSTARCPLYTKQDLRSHGPGEQGEALLSPAWDRGAMLTVDMALISPSLSTASRALYKKRDQRNHGPGKRGRGRGGHTTGPLYCGFPFCLPHFAALRSPLPPKKSIV